MPKPDRDSPEYAHYKAQKKAARAASARAVDGDAASRRDSDSRAVRSRRHRSSSRARHSASDESATEATSAASRRPRRRRSSPRAGSDSPRRDSRSFGGVPFHAPPPAQPYPPHSQPAAFNPSAGSYGGYGGYAAVPPPPPGAYYPSALSPPLHPPAPSYPASTPPGGPAALAGRFTPGQGQAALQSAVPSVFQFQTGGPLLDPSHPPPAAKPAPQDYGNGPPARSLQPVTGVSPSRMPAKPSYLGGDRLGDLAGKLGKLATLDIPAAGGEGGAGSKPPPSPALQPYYGTYQSISPMPSPSFSPAPSPLFSAAGEVKLGKHQAQGSFSIGPPAYPSLQQHQQQQYQQQQQPPPLQAQGLGLPTTYTGESASPAYGLSVGPAGPSLHQPRPPASPRNSSPSPERLPPYDAAADAARILAELKHTFTRPSVQPLLDILPTLTPSQLKALRAEYKTLCRGINLAKHLKSVFTTSTPFGKLVFAVALGPFESEAWFANSWYQKKRTRNELLIESLMGKSNRETALIKACFKDARYNASLEKAVSDELPADKFRMAVMAQLSCSRMDEDRPVDPAALRDDVARLGTILERDASGGETEMVGIIVNRSDRWLRELAALYHQVYDRDLAKAIIRHSKNLAV